jgi:hypothetical protein
MTTCERTHGQTLQLWCEGEGRRALVKAGANAPGWCPGLESHAPTKALAGNGESRTATASTPRIGQTPARDHHPDLYLTGYRNVAIEYRRTRWAACRKTISIPAAKIETVELKPS